MADQFAQIATAGTGLKIDTSELTVNANTVERQRINISDPTTAAAHTAVMNAETAGTEYGVVTRAAGATKIAPYIAYPTANFVRPANATAYSLNKLVANNVTAGSVTPMTFTVGRVTAGAFFIRRAKIKKSSNSVTTCSFRLHLYSALPTVTNGDGGVWLSVESGYLGSLDVTIDKQFSDAASGVGVPIIGSDISFVLASGTSVYGLLEARSAYTPASAETITVYLEVYQS